MAMLAQMFGQATPDSASVPQVAPPAGAQNTGSNSRQGTGGGPQGGSPGNGTQGSGGTPDKGQTGVQGNASSGAPGGENGGVRKTTGKVDDTGNAKADVAQSSNTPAGQQGGTDANSLSPAALKANPRLKQWSKEIHDASVQTGVPADIIGAQIWAESRGNMDTVTNNIDGTQDFGLMQIGEKRLQGDYYPPDIANINVHTPAGNVLAGAYHLSAYLKKNNQNMVAALNDYVGAGLNNQYAGNVTMYAEMLRNDQQLPPYVRDVCSVPRTNGSPGNPRSALHA